MIPIPDLPDSSSDSDNDHSSSQRSSSQPSLTQIQTSLQRMKSRHEAQKQNDMQVRKILTEQKERQQQQRGNYGTYRSITHFAQDSATTGPSITPIFQSNASTRPASAPPGASVTQKSYLQPIPTTKNVIFAKDQQRANPMLKNSSVFRKLIFRKDLIPDFIISKEICILYVSMRFFAQQKNRGYVDFRFKELENMFNTRVLLVNVDLHRKGTNVQAALGKNAKTPHIQDINRGTEHHTDETQKELLTELTKACLRYNATMILAFSNRQAAQYIEMYSQFAHTSRNVLKTKVENDYLPMVRNVLTSVKSVNKTDADTLLKNLGSFKSVVMAQKSDLLNCPGVGSKKVNELLDAFQTPFLPQGNRLKKVTTTATTKSAGAKKKQVGMGKFLKQSSLSSNENKMEDE